jgi:hypothetical protein
METKYNGWKNRSTWLAVVHLDNTSKEISDRLAEIAVNSDTVKEFKARMRPILLETKISGEKGLDFLRIDWEEIWDANRLTK